MVARHAIFEEAVTKYPGLSPVGTGNPCVRARNGWRLFWRLLRLPLNWWEFSSLGWLPSWGLGSGSGLSGGSSADAAGNTARTTMGSARTTALQFRPAPAGLTDRGGSA